MPTIHTNTGGASLTDVNCTLLFGLFPIRVTACPLPNVPSTHPSHFSSQALVLSLILLPAIFPTFPLTSSTARQWPKRLIIHKHRKKLPYTICDCTLFTFKSLCFSEILFLWSLFLFLLDLIFSNDFCFNVMSNRYPKFSQLRFNCSLNLWYHYILIYRPSLLILDKSFTWTAPFELPCTRRMHL